MPAKALKIFIHAWDRYTRAKARARTSRTRAATTVITRGDDPPYPPMSVRAGLIAKTAIVSGPPAPTKSPQGANTQARTSRTRAATTSGWSAIPGGPGRVAPRESPGMCDENYLTP